MAAIIEKRGGLCTHTYISTEKKEKKDNTSLTKPSPPHTTIVLLIFKSKTHVGRREEERMRREWDSRVGIHIR